jgi:bloom syndrome protein
MSEKLPATEEEMLMLPHVTKANFLKYGKQLLEVTENYNAEKELLMLDLKEADLEESDESGDENTDWAALGSQASASSMTSGRGVKRKVKWTARKTTKRVRKTTKKRSPKKRAASTSRPGKAPAAKKPTGRFQLLPMPGTSSW